MLETFVAVTAIVALALVFGFIWHRMGRSLNSFYVFIVFCAIDMIMLLSMGMVMNRPLAVWKVAIGFFFPPPLSLVFLI